MKPMAQPPHRPKATLRRQARGVRVWEVHYAGACPWAGAVGTVLCARVRAERALVLGAGAYQKKALRGDEQTPPMTKPPTHAPHVAAGRK